MIINYRQAVAMDATISYVDYIESSGTQYIDTGFKPNNNTRVVVDVHGTKAGTYAVFGARRSITSQSFTVWMMNSSTFRSDFHSSQNSVNVASVLNRIVIDKNKNVCRFGDISTTNSNATFQAPINLFLFAVNDNGEPEGRNFSGRLYSCQIYDNDTLIRDYTPALDPDGVACLYDKVSGQYVYNSGTGSFITP